jgi:hypothetical protein
MSIDRQLAQLERQILAEPDDFELVAQYFRVLKRSGWKPRKRYEDAKEHNDWRSLIWIVENRGRHMSMREEAVYRLGKIKHPAALSTLIKVAGDREEAHGIRIDAVHSLNALGHPAAIPVLLDIVNDESQQWMNIYGYSLDVLENLGVDIKKIKKIKKTKRRKNIDEGIQSLIRDYRMEPNAFAIGKIIRAYDRANNKEEAAKWSMVLWQTNPYEPTYQIDYLNRLWDLDMPIIRANKFLPDPSQISFLRPSEIGDFLEDLDILSAADFYSGAPIYLFSNRLNRIEVEIIYDQAIFVEAGFDNQDPNRLIQRHDNIFRNQVNSRLGKKIPEYKELYPGVEIVYYDARPPDNVVENAEIPRYLIAIHGLNRAFERHTGIIDAEIFEDEDEESPVPEWIHQLGPGDQVIWTDPDGEIPNILTIQSIEIHYDIIHITHEHGEVEVYAHELS